MQEKELLVSSYSLFSPPLRGLKGCSAAVIVLFWHVKGYFFFFSGYKGLVDVDKKGVPGLTVTTADRFERTRYITFINNVLYENNHALTLTVSPSLSQSV